ncbi:drug/metabolite exporter YedA [Lysobacter sp. CJ11]|uniref:Drug/metabolite exporter YedA n=1 Tax=Lysobacter soyae TaxID=2764185 RepID=A0ABX8WR91_9GAMM|nr:drug/metabolite exporter YedA [Lysobacter sp. CJ11]
MGEISPAKTPGTSMIWTALIAVYLIWGSTYLAIRFALEGGLPPFLMAGVRFVIAGALMLIFLRLRGEKMPTRMQWRNVSIMGLLLLVFGNGLVCVAEQTVSSGLTAVAVASAPIWMGIFSALRGEHPSKPEWIGIAIGFIGVLWLNAGSSLSGSMTGMIALILASLAWSFGSIWSRGKDLPTPFVTSGGQMLAGGLLMLVVALVLGERWPHEVSNKALGSVAYLIVMGSIIGFSAYVWLLKHVRPALAGSYAYVNPVIAVILGALLANEKFGTNDLLPMGIILLGVVAMTVGKARRAK